MLVDSSAHRTWEAALGRLQLQVTRPIFETWLRGTTGVSFDSGELVVRVQSTFAAEHLEKRMHDLIFEAVAAVASEPVSVSFQVQGAAAHPVAQPPESPRPGIASVPVSTPLNPNYTFESFVVGDNSHLAYAAAMAVADAPGTAYNPLYLYGAVGLGKTHLLHAIGHRALSAGKTVAYVTCEQFTNEFLLAIRDRKTEQFRQRYRNMDLLLLDDIQFISGKESTQEGFFHTFNALHDSGRQVVLTSDRQPSALPLLEERLRSRFEWGLIADISAPSIETRTAILAHYASHASVPVPPDVLEFIASRVSGNVRQLEGCLNRVTAMAQFTNVPVDISLATRSLGVTTAAGQTTPKSVIESVAAHYGVTPALLLSSRRDKLIAAARQLAMYILHRRDGLSPEEIGSMLGGRDRTTVIYNIKRLTRRLESDTTFSAEVQHLVDQQPSSSTAY